MQLSNRQLGYGADEMSGEEQSGSNFRRSTINKQEAKFQAKCQEAKCQGRNQEKQYQEIKNDLLGSKCPNLGELSLQQYAFLVYTLQQSVLQQSQPLIGTNIIGIFVYFYSFFLPIVPNVFLCPSCANKKGNGVPNCFYRRQVVIVMIRTLLYQGKT